MSQEEKLFSPRYRLVWKYALLIGALVTSSLVMSGTMTVYFSYHENKLALQHIQRERALSAAAAIERFVENVEAQVGWTMHAAFLSPNDMTTQRQIDFVRLMRQAPEITEIKYVDHGGHERLMVSRLSVDRVESGKDHSSNENFQRAKELGKYFSPIYFRRASEPYLSVSLRGQGGDNGVTIADVNLKFVWDLINRLDTGAGGSAFVIDANGQLIAHRDLSLVLRKTDLSSSPQMFAAQSAEFARTGGIIDGLDGKKVLSSYAPIQPLGWYVFVESPLRQAFATLYDSIFRTAALIFSGVVLSIFAALFLARRIVKPIKELQNRVNQIADGKLDHDVQIRTGDELEQLADDVNRMSVKLRKSYDAVERLSALKRYFSPHLAELIVSSDQDNLTESHRREISVIFCDLRNFTEFSTVAEPEEAMAVLDLYYKALGTRLREFEATIGHFAGDGLMAFLNDPLPCRDHASQTVKMALAIRNDVAVLLQRWEKRGLELGFGIGLSTGYATLGHIGTGEQFHYTAIGSVVNLASRLCDEAQNGEILISEPVFAKTEDMIEVSLKGEYELKGFPKAIKVLKLIGLREVDHNPSTQMHQVDFDSRQ